MGLTSKLSPSLVGVNDVKESFKRVDLGVRGVLTDMAQVPVDEIIQRISDSYKIEQGITPTQKQLGEDEDEKN
jgi:hypothetical protein